MLKGQQFVVSLLPRMLVSSVLTPWSSSQDWSIGYYRSFSSRWPPISHSPVSICVRYTSFPLSNLPKALIAYRIWSIESQLNKVISERRGNSPVLPVIIESSAVYSASLICLTALFAAGSWAQYIVLDTLVQLIVSTIRLVLAYYGLISPFTYRESSSLLSLWELASDYRMAQHLRWRHTSVSSQRRLELLVSIVVVNECRWLR